MHVVLLALISVQCPEPKVYVFRAVFEPKLCYLNAMHDPLNTVSVPRQGLQFSYLNLTFQEYVKSVLISVLRLTPAST